MNATRSSVVIRVAFVAATAILFLAATGQAQSGGLKANMPFGFYAGDQLMPAGEYEIHAFGNGGVKISNYDAHKAIVFFTVGLNQVTVDPISPRLVFNRYGEDYFLSEMWWGSQGARKSVPSKSELRLAKVITPDQTVTLAHR